MKRKDSALGRAEDLELVEEVLAALRHDIRNKLASVRQASHYLKTKTQTTELWTADPRIERFFGLIDSQIESADGFLSSHEILQKIHARAPAMLDPRRVITEAVNGSVAPDAVDVGEIAEGAPFGDEAEIVLAVVCLIDNAIEANPDARPSITGKIVAGRYVITVTDSGTSLGEAAFQQFVGAFSSSKPGRRGLGLTMVKRIAHRYGGSVQMEKLPQGTAISLSIGLAPASVADAPAKPRRVLVVDDDDGARVTFAALLEDEGFDVLTASSKGEAEELLDREAPFHATFIDVHLDGVDGTELVAPVRLHSAEAVVVLVSGDGKGVLPTGVDGWIVKGGDPAELIQAARNYVQGSVKATAK